MMYPGTRRSLILVTLALMLLPVLSFVYVHGDGGYIPMMNINVYEPGQNAIICWNGERERMYLSINIHAERPTEGIHFVPFPSLPKVSLGDFETFERMERVFLRELDFHSFEQYDSDGTSGAGGGEEKSFDVKFTATLGSHSITVIEIVDPDDFKDQISDLMEEVGSSIEAWPSGLEDVIIGYCNKGYCYFAVDRFQIGNEPGSVEPLIYDFKTPELVFPLEISSILKGETTIKLALITSEDHPIDVHDVTGSYTKKGEGILSLADVLEIDPALDGVFDRKCIGQYFEMYLKLPELKGDFIITTMPGVTWCMAGTATAEYTYEDGSGRSLLLSYERYYDKKEQEIRLVDETNGEVIWTSEPLAGEHMTTEYSLSRIVAFEDMNGLGGPEIVLVDTLYNRTNYDVFVSRLDINNGEPLWSRKINTRTNIRGSFSMNGFEQTLFVLYDDQMINVFSLETGNNWNSSQYSSMLRAASLSAVSGKDAQIIMLENTKQTMTCFIDPWKGSIETLWSVPSTGGSAVYFRGEDLICFRENDHHIFRRVMNGTAAYAYKTNDRLIGHYFDKAAPGRLNGITISYNYPEMVIGKVSISDQTTIWRANITQTAGIPPSLDKYTCTYTDIDRDGIKEVVIYVPSTVEPYNAGQTPSKLSTMVLDGRNGSLLFSSAGKLMGIEDPGPGGAVQVCLNEMQHITIHDLRNGECLTRSAKKYPLSGEVLRSFKDINNDGYTDIITSTYNRTIYGGAISLGDAYINGQSQKCERFVDLDTSTAYQFGCILSGLNGNIIYREGYRLYSRQVESDLMITSDRQEIYVGENVRFFLKAGSGSIPSSLGDIDLSSSLAMGMFADLKQLLPGLYSFVWKAPETYTGEVSIRARVLMGGIPVSEAKTTITVLRTPDIDEEISSLSIHASISGDSVLVNEPVLVEINIAGAEDPLLLDLELTDLSVCGIVSQPIMTSENSYIGSFIPVREIEFACLLLEVRYGDELVLRRIWPILVIPVERETEDEEVAAIGDPQVFPKVLEPEGSALIFIPFSGTSDPEDLRVICDDNGRGGTFSNMR
ncbi:MAG: DUF2330 domain-containing protein, partial [Thermoplasmatota archaeon]